MGSEVLLSTGRLICGVCAVLLAGCTVVSGQLGVSYQNRVDPGTSFLEPAHPVPRATMNWRPDRPIFVGVAISGGGSRAANFGMAVLTELQAQGILPQVDAISAVSGGSIPTAFFALNGEREDWAERGRAVAGTDFLSVFLGKLFNPVNVAATTFTDKDRSDLLAEVFESKVLGGHTVFGELGPRGPMRPAVYFNATDTTNDGNRFVFADDRFLRLLGSDLSRFPLAWAMASSGAFPGVFNSVTLRRFSLDPEVRKHEEALASGNHFVHLIDGGSSDNFGTDTLIELARQHHVELLKRNQQPQGCLIIVVDSHVPNAAIADAQRSDRRNWLSMFVDLNFLDAIDAMLSNRRGETLTTLGIRRDQALGSFSIPIGNGLIEYNVQPYRRVGNFEIEYFEQEGRPIVKPTYAGLADTLDFAGIRKAAPKSFSCMAWHVALDDIHSIVPWRERNGEFRPLDLRVADDREVFAYRARLARLIKQIETNYRVKGPPRCESTVVQSALYDAARIAVREDKASLDAVCSWFTARKLIAAGVCRTEPVPLLRTDLVIEPIVVPRDETAAEQNTNRFVQCPTPGQAVRNER
jgi:predicted acylesterase/phospholipase RssA